MVENIEKFLESYWKLSPAADKIDRLVRRDWQLVPQDNLTDVIEDEINSYREYLMRKYGKDTIIKQEETGRRHLGELSHTTYHETYTGLFKSGLVDEYPIQTVLRARTTLASLLEILQKEKPFTIADLGCGDGKIAIGLALGIESLEKLYAIDINPHALAILEKNIQSLKKEEQKIARSKISLIQNDYSNENFSLINKVDISLAAYPLIGASILPVANRINKIGGRTLIYKDFPEEIHSQQVVFDWSNYNRILFTLADEKPFWCGAKVVGCITT